MVGEFMLSNRHDRVGWQVMRSGAVSRYTPGQVEVDQLRDITELELRTRTFGAPAPEPLLGRHFALPRRPDRQERVVLDDSLQTVSAPFDSLRSLNRTGNSDRLLLFGKIYKVGNINSQIYITIFDYK